MSQDKINSAKDSSIESTLRLLARGISTERAERFLLDFANLRETDPASVSRIQKHYSDFLPFAPGQGKEHSSPRMIFNLQFLLRQAWDCPTLLDRDLHLSFTLHNVYEQFLQAAAKRPEEGSALHRIWKALGNTIVALTLARLLVDRMRRCQNSACPVPYFLAKHRNQRFCSKICAGPAQRKLKKAWWSEHGDEWRSKRRTKGGQSRKSDARQTSLPTPRG